MADKKFESAAEFLAQLKLGLLDGNLHEAFAQLNPEQLEEVADAFVAHMKPRRHGPPRIETD